MLWQSPGETSAEDQMMLRGELSAHILDTVGALVVVLDTAGRIVLFNKAAQELTGYSFDEVRDKCVWDLLVLPEEVARVKGVFDRLRAGDFPNKASNYWVARDGSRRLIAWSNTATQGPDGAVEYVIGTGVDVTELDEVQAALRGSEARLRSIIETSPDGVVIINEKGTIESFSPVAERMFGFSAAEAVGQNVAMLMPSPHRECHDGYISRYLETGEAAIIGIGREMFARRKDGTTFPIELAIGEIFDRGRRRFTGFIRDIGPRRQAEARAHQLEADLLRVSRVSAMGEMASALAHELNQPLTAMTNYVQASRRMIGAGGGPGSATLTEFMDKAVRQAERAGSIIHHLRHFIGGGETERSLEDINDVVEEACGLALLGAADTAVDPRFELSPTLPPLLIDKIQIQQVVVNLVRNAVDALQQAERRELSIATAMNDDGSGVEVTIRDTGPGLHPAIAERLFQPFLTTKPGGLGIGLPISRSIIDAHGGRLWAECPADGGTVFHFSLPAVSDHAE